MGFDHADLEVFSISSGSCALFSYSSLSSEGRDWMEISHLGLSFPKSLTFLFGRLLNSHLLKAYY